MLNETEQFKSPLQKMIKFQEILKKSIEMCNQANIELNNNCCVKTHRKALFYTNQKE